MLDRSIKPSPIGKIDFSLPTINTFELPNSLKVYHVHKKVLPIVQINLMIPAGSIYTDDNQIGLSTLTSMLIDESAGNLSSLEISDKIEMLGSILNISSNKEFVTLSLLALKENLDKSLELFSLILTSPNFNDSDFDRELHRLKTQIVQLNDDPSYVASTEFQKIIYNSTPYQNPSSGLSETINNLSNENVQNYYSNQYSPNGSYLVIVGDFEEKEINKTLNKYFDNWNNQAKIIQPIIKTNETNKKIILIDKPDAAQSEIRVGHFSKGRNSEDFFSRTILNSILGGQFSSRINLNLREDKGYTYGAHSNYAYNQIGSTFSVSTSVKAENTVDAVKEILFELKNIKSTITEDEIAFSKSYLVRRYPSLFETFTQVATNVSLIPIFNLPKEYFTNYIENINQVNLQSVTKAANNNIIEEDLVIVVVGDTKKVDNTLREFASSTEFEYLSKN